MKEQLTSYVELLFAAAPDADDVKQEILHNTLDRYDDLITQGKTPQAAYQLAISGIGDINELLGSSLHEQPAPSEISTESALSKTVKQPAWKKIVRAIAICLYIICPIPLFVLGELGMGIIGLCGMLSIIAVATALIIIASSKEPHKKEQPQVEEQPESELTKAINSIIWAVGLCGYFLLSFITQAWYITWVIFPLIAAVKGLIKACIDLKEATNHEN